MTENKWYPVGESYQKRLEKARKREVDEKRKRVAGFALFWTIITVLFGYVGFLVVGFFAGPAILCWLGLLT